MAFGVLVAAQELGLRVPEDLSVIGIDDHSWSETYGLTTIRQNPHEQGAVAAKLMLDELGGVRTRQRVIRADWQLVVRRTTAPPRAHGDPATLHRPVGVLEHT
jgi:DNA-binding LacI/PurR family transcriptional regulator